MNMRVGVIASMKKGLEHFVYREVTAFAQQGAAISLFPTKFSRGLYNARDEWQLYRWHPLIILFLQPYYLLKERKRYLDLIRLAIQMRAPVDFALAWYFAPRMKNVDVIYATFADHKLFIGYFCKLILNKPLVVTIHAYELYNNPNPRLFLRALDACDQIITVTEFNRDLLEREYGVDPDKIEVIRISLDTQEYIPEEKFVILIVGFFAERKGHDQLFKAIKKLNDPSIDVWVVGDEGTERSVDVPALAKKLGIDSQVSFFGRQGGNALKALYRACDVFCLPCRTDSAGVAEGFPAVLMEAMSFGKPVITTRHVEIPRVIPEIVVDENDVDALAEAIQQVRDSSELRQRLSRQNRKIAEELFSSSNTKQTMAVLQRLAGGQRSAVTSTQQAPTPVGASSNGADD